jgi:dTDP-4-dehydrorhamnose 3,5-epimerase-like enzyme
MLPKLLKIKTKKTNSLGSLSFFEYGKDISFLIKRVYYTYNVPKGTKRGMHAHKNLNQIMWVPYGSVLVILDDGLNKTSYLLDSPIKALLVPSGYWRDLFWKKSNSILVVGASDLFNEDDYIRDYKKFIKFKRV